MTAIRAEAVRVRPPRVGAVAGALTLLTTLVVVETASAGGAGVLRSAAGLAVLARAAVLLAACGTVGSLALAALVLRRSAAAADAVDGRGAAAELLTSATRWALLWVAAAGGSLALLLWQTDQGAAVAAAGVHGGVDPATAVRDAVRAAVVTGWAAGLVAVLARGATGPRQALGVLVLAYGALVPAVLVGHAGHADAQWLAIASMLVHVIAVTTWVGGMLGMVSHATRGVVAVVSAFSTVALLCFLAVGASGVAVLGTQLSWAELVSAGAYQWLVLAKLGGLVALGLCGVAHRRHTLRRLRTGHPSAFWMLAAGEIVLMAAVVGTAAVLGQTAR